MINLARSILASFGVALCITVVSVSVSADEHDGGRRGQPRHDGGHGGQWHGARYGGPRWHGDIHNFYARDYPHWHGGHWYHGDHDGRWGWWWLAAGMWDYYPAPVYPYPDPYSPSAVIVPPAPATERPPQQQSWYYCQSAGKYYPYVSECPEGWKAVPAIPPDVPSQ